MKAIALLLAISATVNTNTSILHDANDKTVTYKTTPAASAHDQCIQAASVIVGKSTCTDVYGIVVVGTCDAAPKFPVKVNADGYLEVPEMRIPVLANGTDWGPPEIQAMVPAPYPTCWQIGWVPYTGQEYTTDDVEPVMDPVAWPAELLALWDASKSERTHKSTRDD